MRILLITVRSDFGGGPRHVDQLIGQLPSNIEIYAAYPFDGDPYGEKWRNCGRIKKSIALPYRKFSINALLKLKKFVDENEIDIVHSHGHGAGVYSRLLKCVGAKAKVVHTFHGVTSGYTSMAKKMGDFLSGRFFRLFTDCFICVSRGEYDRALKKKFLNPQCAKIIYNGIENFPEFNRVNTQFDVISLSRFDYSKNMDMAIEIARKLKGTGVRFVWVGDGPDFERLKNVAEQESLDIVFTGFAKEPFKYLQTASVCLSTSRFEGLPYALIEASSIGLPVVATNVIGNNETVEDGKSGYLFNTIGEAAEYILRLKKDSRLYQEMSAQSKAFFEKNFTLKKMINRLVGLYQELC